jgi:hypothetical protein
LTPARNGVHSHQRKKAMSPQLAEKPNQPKSLYENSPWVSQAKAHWKQFRPKMYAELEKKGLLHERAVKAAEQTEDDLLHLVNEEGLDHQAAWEAVRERYLFLPSEEDQPDLAGPNSTPEEQEPTTESPTPTRSESEANEPSTETMSPPFEPSSA